MRKINTENERIKRRYVTYLEQAKGQDEKSTEKVLAALLKFEESTRFKRFKAFHVEQARGFKDHLANVRNQRTGKPLSHSTVDATLRMVKAFFLWLAGQPGFKSVLSYSDCEYFNNTAKNARIAHAKRDIPFPSMEQCAHAFAAMPNATEFERRDKALFAFFMLTGARDGAVASLRMKHVNLAEEHVFQDAREVNTKNAKTIDTWFFPVGGGYLDCFRDWYTFLKTEKLFGPEDALFPKAETNVADGRFTNSGLSRQGYAGAGPLIAIIRGAFSAAGLPEYTPHSFRKTLALYGDSICPDRESFKAWSMNLGHENLATTISAYMPVSAQRQRELIRALGNRSEAA